MTPSIKTTCAFEASPLGGVYTQVLLYIENNVFNIKMPIGILNVNIEHVSF